MSGNETPLGRATTRDTLSSTTAMPVVLLGWRPLVKGSLRGFASIQLGKSLRINDISVLCSNGKLWAAMPGKPLIAEGRAVVDDQGKQKYTKFLEWSDKAAADRFSAAVIAAIRAEHGPEALEPAA
jgi:hypothetical protein